MTKGNSSDPVTLYRFSSKFFETNDFSTMEPFLLKITACINKGYDEIHGKYGYLDTRSPRIANHRNFIDEFHFLDRANYLLILIRSQDATDEEVSTRLHSKDVPLVEASFDKILIYNDIPIEHFIGTVIINSLPSTPSLIEPKAFVSYFRGVGRFLLEVIEPLIIKEYKEVTHLTVQVLVCHELVPLYLKFGYTEYLPRQTQIVKEGIVIDGCMIGVPAHKGYEIAWMKKQIRF